MTCFSSLLNKVAITSRTLSVKLFLLLVVLLGIAFTIILHNNIKTYNSHLQENVFDNAIRLSNIIKRATYYSMLKNSREDLTNIITSIGREDGIDRVRIYNREGKISFSDNLQEINQTADKEAGKCFVCHKEEPAKGITVDTKDLMRILISEEGNRQLAFINPIENEPKCYNADCHAHPKNVKKLGMLDVKLSLKKIDQEILITKKKVLVYSIALILLTALLKGGFILKLIHFPIRKLIYGTKEVAKLNLDYQVNLNSRDELGNLARSFNEMTGQLKTANESVQNWSAQLEKRVREKTEELKKTQSHLILTEKMASLGRLSAMVAHEIINPLSGILSYSKLTSRYLNHENFNSEMMESAQKNLGFISNEAKRCGEIVKNLLIFAKKTLGDIKEEHLNDIINNSINVITHSAKMKNIALIKDLDEDDLIHGDVGALQQIFIVLIVNAMEAMPRGGKITVSTDFHKEKNKVRIVVADNGTGMPEEIMPHIFDPFFTTKETEKSTGLGLSVVYGIVEQHGGDIKVESKVNQGTKFIITLPRVPPQKNNNHIPKNL